MTKLKTPLQKVVEEINKEIANTEFLIEHKELNGIGVDTFYLDRLIGLKIKTESLIPEERQAIVDARINDYPPTESSKLLGQQYFNDKYESQ